MSNRLGGLQGTAYLGTNANNPPNLTYNTYNPTPNDSQNYSVGDWWLNTVNEQLYYLASLAGNGMSKGSVATWLQVSTGAVNQAVHSFITDALGPVVPTNAGVVTISGVSGIYGQMLQTIGGGVNTLQIAPNFPLIAGSDGMVFIAGSSGGKWARLTAGPGTAIGNGDGAIVITNLGGGGGGGMVLAHTDGADAAINVGDNSFNFFGNGVFTATQGNAPGSSITIGQVANPTITGNVTFPGTVKITGLAGNAGVLVVDVAGNITSSTSATAFPGQNQFLMGGPPGIEPLWGTITPADGSVVVTSTAAGITIRAPGAGGGNTNAAQYILQIIINVPSQHPAAIYLGPANGFNVVFDRAGAPQFVGTTYTCNTTGVWYFSVNIIINNSPGPFTGFLAIQVNDPIQPVNSRRFSTFLDTSGQSPQINGNLSIDTMILMNATSTITFFVYSSPSNPAPAYSIRGTSWISWYYVSA